MRQRVARLGERASAHPWVIVLALMALVGVFGLVGLGESTVLLDESVSIQHANESWAGLWDVVRHSDPNMSLYYAALKVWIGFFGDGAFAVRALSLLCAVLCLPVVYVLGVRLFGVAAGLLSAVFLSLNDFFLHYAQEARSYALVTLLVALSTYFFLRELERPQAWNRVAYVASAVLAFYAHYFAFWVLLVQAGTLVALRRRHSVTRGWLGCYGAMLVLALPMVYWVLTLDGDPIFWIQRPGWGAIPATYAQHVGDSFLHLGIVIAACLVVVGRGAVSKRLAFGLAFTAASAFLPVLATFAVSQVKPILLAKYLIVCLPAMVLFAAGAITSLRPVGAAAAVACVFVALSIVEVRDYYGPGEPPAEISASPEHLTRGVPA